MTSPVVIGAMGGSGTRVIARMVERAGVFIGTNRNVSEDAMEFVDFYDRWINRVLLSRTLPRGAEAEMSREFQRCVARHRAGLQAPDAAWGWKEPRSIYLLPFFHSRYADLRFVHVVRDGRDMAFSANQNQLRKHGDALLGVGDGAMPRPVRAAMLWQAINVAAADYGEAVLGARYLRVRFEDVCADPASAGRRILEFVGTGINGCAGVDVVTPESLGRWRNPPQTALVADISQCARTALIRFGYDA